MFYLNFEVFKPFRASQLRIHYAEIKLSDDQSSCRSLVPLFRVVHLGRLSRTGVLVMPVKDLQSPLKFTRFIELDDKWLANRRQTFSSKALEEIPRKKIQLKFQPIN